MKLARRIIVCLATVAIAMCASAAVVETALAGETYNGETLTWTLDDAGVHQKSVGPLGVYETSEYLSMSKTVTVVNNSKHKGYLTVSCDYVLPKKGSSLAAHANFSNRQGNWSWDIGTYGTESGTAKLFEDNGRLDWQEYIDPGATMTLDLVCEAGDDFTATFDIKVNVVDDRIRIETAKPTVKATKLSANKIALVIKVPEAQAAEGLTRLDIMSGSAVLKSFNTTGETTYRCTVSKKGLGAKKIKVVAVNPLISDDKIASSQVTPGANKKSFKAASKIGGFPANALSAEVKSLSYSGKYLVVKIVQANKTDIAFNLSAPFTIYVDGKKIASKTFAAKAAQKPGTVKTYTFKVKAPVADLRNGEVSVLKF